MAKKRWISSLATQRAKKKTSSNLHLETNKKFSLFGISIYLLLFIHVRATHGTYTHQKTTFILIHFGTQLETFSCTHTHYHVHVKWIFRKLFSCVAKKKRWFSSHFRFFDLRCKVRWGFRHIFFPSSSSSFSFPYVLLSFSYHVCHDN